MVTWQKENISVGVSYIIEYIDNKKDWDYVCSGSNKHGEPWERYKKKLYFSLDEAITQYMIGYFSMYSTKEKDDKIGIFDIRLFEEVIVNGEVVRESHIEPNVTTMYHLRRTFGDEQIRLLDRLQHQLNDQLNLIERYDAFIKSYHAEDAFKKFVNQG